MAIGDTFHRVLTVEDMGDERQVLTKVIIVNPADYVITADEDGVLQYEEKAAVVDDDDDDDAPAAGSKYRLEPEGNMFRIYAEREMMCNGSYVPHGHRGGLVAHDRVLSQQGTCWIDARSAVHDGVGVSGDAWVGGDSVVKGKYFISGHASIVSCQIDGLGQIFGNAELLQTTIVCNRGTVDIFGTTKVRESAIDVNSSGPFTLNGCCVNDASLRNNGDVVSVWTRWGWLSAFRDKDGDLAFRVGCQYLGDFDQLRQVADDNSANALERAQLEGFIVMAQAMENQWNR